MKPKLPNLSQLIKTGDQKGFLIKVAFVSFVALVALVALFFELQFRKTVVLEGIIRGCWYENSNVSCSYLETSNGNFLLTDGRIAKVLQERPGPVSSLYDKKVRVIGFLSRQKFEVRNLGIMHRFQIENLEFLE